MDDLASQTYNAGTGRNLEEVRAAARERASAREAPVLIFEHVGGRHPKDGMVTANHSFLWRDKFDHNGQPLPTPKFVWRQVEEIAPGAAPIERKPGPLDTLTLPDGSIYQPAVVVSPGVIAASPEVRELFHTQYSDNTNGGLTAEGPLIYAESFTVAQKLTENLRGPHGERLDVKP